MIGVDEQIAGAVNIAVVQVLGATPTGDGRLNYEFLVQKRLAGMDRRSFALMEAEPVRGLAQESSFDNHEDPAFWARGGGRLMNYMDCQLYPAYVVGNSYLLFWGSPQTRRSAEKIETVGMSFNRRDKWLLYVEAALEKLRRGDAGRRD